MPHTHADGDAFHTTHSTDELSVITLKAIPKACLPQVQQEKLSAVLSTEPTLPYSTQTPEAKIL